MKDEKILIKVSIDSSSLLTIKKLLEEKFNTDNISNYCDNNYIGWDTEIKDFVVGDTGIKFLGFSRIDMCLLFSIDTNKLEVNIEVKRLFGGLYPTNLLIKDNLSFRKYVRMLKIDKMLENVRKIDTIDIDEYLKIELIKPFLDNFNF